MPNYGNQLMSVIFRFNNYIIYKRRNEKKSLNKLFGQLSPKLR